MYMYMNVYVCTCMYIHKYLHTLSWIVVFSYSAAICLTSPAFASQEVGYGEMVM